MDEWLLFHFELECFFVSLWHNFFLVWREEMKLIGFMWENTINWLYKREKITSRHQAVIKNEKEAVFY